MKITGYTQSITNVGGSSGTPRLNLSASAKASASEAIDLNPVIKGIGDVAKTIDYVHEQQDAQTAFNALNEYNQTMNNIMYNEENGLCRMQGSSASGISQSFANQEKEARAKLMDGYKFHSARQQLALNNAMDKITTGNMKGVADWEYKQGEVARATTYKNNEQTILSLTQNQYSNVEAISGYADLLALNAGENAKNKGSEAQALAARQARASVFRNAMSNALAKDDYSAFEALKEQGGVYLDANDRVAFEKVSYQKQNDNFNRSIAQEAFSLFPNDPAKAKEYIMQKGSFNGGVKSGSLVDSVRSIGIPYVASDGTNCMRTMGMALKGTPYEGQINVDQAVATAKANGQLISDPNYVPKAGDMAVVEGGNHIVMVTEKGGTIQNGASHNGVWESDMSPRAMFGNVKYYIRSSDYQQQGATGASTRASDPAQVDKAMSYYNRLQSEERSRQVIENKAFFDSQSDVLRQMYEGGTNQAAVMQYIKENCGNDLKKAKMLEGIANDWGKIYGANFTAGGIGNRSGVKATLDDYKISQMLRNGDIPTQNTMLKLMSELGANPTQTSKFLKEWDKWFQRKGEYSVDMDGIKAAVFGKTNGLSPQQQGQWRAVQSIIARECNKVAVKEHRDLDFTEMVEIGRKAVESKVYSPGIFSDKKTTRADALNAGIVDFAYQPDGTVWVETKQGTQAYMDVEDFENRLSR